MKRYLGRDAVTGAVETFEYDESNDTCIIHRQSSDVAPILEENKQLANHANTWNADKSGRLVAQIPIDVQYLWLFKYGVRAWDKNHWPAVKRLLNDNEWRYLKTQNVII